VKAVVAYRGGDDGTESLSLASTLRRTTGAELTVVAVLPPVSDHPGIARVDLEYREWLDTVAAEAQGRAASMLSPQNPSALAFQRVESASVGSGLAQVADSSGADVLVLGSARAATEGAWLMGSVAERLLHSSPVPLLLAPQGYTSGPDAKFTRLTCAFAGTEQSKESLHASCALAVRFDLDIRVATFVPRAETMYPPEVGFDAEDMVAAQAAEQAVGLHDEAQAIAKEAGVNNVETIVARGKGWDGALQGVSWETSDVLVFGSSRLGPLARVFLGSTANKILRHTPVPALVIPSGTTTWS
jgi:nucleotide-binding universal stress UspA family protein